MPASDTWPCKDAMEPLVSMNSASSCDSMVSTNSGFSDDSMEHLSAEERACLMFLEETIEALEAEDDSGVSNDEPDVLSPATKVDHLRPGGQTKAEELSSHYDPNKILGKDHKPNGLPTQLVLTNGNESGEPAKLPPNPTTVEPIADESDELADLPPAFIPEPPVMADPSSDSKTKECPPKTQLEPMLDQMPKTQKFISVPSDMLMELIPPPSDFMDEPEPAPPVPTQPPKQSQLQPRTQSLAQVQVKPQTQAPSEHQAKLQTQAPSQDLAKPQPQTHAPSQDLAKPQTQPQTQAPSQDLAKPQTPPQTQAQTKPQNQSQPQPQLPLQLQAQPPSDSITIAPPLGFGGQAEDDHAQSTVTSSPRGPLSPTQLDVLRKKASLKKAPEKAPIVRPSGQKVSNQASFSVYSTEGHPPTAVGHSQPKSPPAVAPKPKKLSPKIVLKSHKDSVPGHSLVSSGDRMMNPQKVHIEALKKLGLLKADETDSAPSLSSSPPHRIPPPSTFNTTTVPPSGDAAHETKLAEVEAQGKMILPAQSNPENDGRGSPVIPRESRKNFEIKSASLERPKMGLKSVTADHSSLIMNQEKNQEKTNLELSPGQLRRSRSRPASAGSQKEMGIDQLSSNSGKEQDVRRSLGSSPIPPLVQPSTDSQVPSRSHGMISVVFTPQSKNGEERRQALKRLGLI
ncbi:specifically androgen-regulated gene protein [Astyanax mexicanus]|uniref:specifically androgen-regulated gene protein n=1 Tax=Astyanax mexicanus TaxID=7994 RepID=UPI0020CB59DC|nr:specifically androgen-regulated gene protein [Astyanax mexicanus]XP_007233492.3 specifically androgen-regulated gene protein [Astyanax mexicanus]